MTNPDDTPNWYRLLKGIGCGTTAGIAVTLVGHPFDTLKVRLQTQNNKSPLYSGVFDCVRKTLQWEGIQGLYKGVVSPISGQIFFRTAMFTTYYETLHYLNVDPLDINSDLKNFFIAGLVTGLVVSFPDSVIELLKSKMQFQIIAEKKNIPISTKYMGVLHCFNHTLATHGLRGVLQGLGPTLLRDTPGYMLYFGSNEYFKRLFVQPGQRTSDIGMFKTMLCAGLTGIVFWVCMYNIDVIKSAMMADDIDRNSRKYKNILDCAKKLYANEGGYKRFWVGFTPCMARAFLANALMLYIVDLTRDLFPSYRKSNKSL